MKSYLVVDSLRPRFDGAIVERTIANGQTQIELLSGHSMEMTWETTLEGVGDNSSELRRRAASGQKGRHRSTEHRVPEWRWR
jgi:hypothetical protein